MALRQRVRAGVELLVDLQSCEMGSETGGDLFDMYSPSGRCCILMPHVGCLAYLLGGTASPGVAEKNGILSVSFTASGVAGKCPCDTGTHLVIRTFYRSHAPCEQYSCSSMGCAKSLTRACL